MSNAKEIHNKIRSIQSTQKITRAMEMVAASKMRKAQMRMRASRPYLQRVMDVISHLVHSKLEYTHPYLIKREVKKVACLVISSDRGLCGSLNNNLFRKVITELGRLHKQNISADIFTIGKKAEKFFVRNGFNILASISDLTYTPKVQDLIGIIKVILDGYDIQNYDQLYIAYNKFFSTISQKPQMDLLLPVIDPLDETSSIKKDYIYEPTPEVLLDTLLHRYIETIVYQGVVENIACEQAARMVAMKNASDNAGELIDNLKLMYNKARQAAITKELAEIVAGAAAV